MRSKVKSLIEEYNNYALLYPPTGPASKLGDEERLEEWTRTMDVVCERGFTELADACQAVKSPIEEKFMLALWRAEGYGCALRVIKPDGRVVAHFTPSHPVTEELFVQPQAPVGRYTADFRLTRRFPLDGRTYTAEVAIECDGHDFHEKTKKQAAHDKKRDRYFASIDLPVLRFTGSEIHKDADACAEEAMNLLAGKLTALVNGGKP